jgi:hypothetical protein
MLKVATATSVRLQSLSKRLENVKQFPCSAYGQYLLHFSQAVTWYHVWCYIRKNILILLSQQHSCNKFCPVTQLVDSFSKPSMLLMDVLSENHLSLEEKNYLIKVSVLQDGTL